MAYMLLMMEPVGQRQARTEAEGREAYGSMVRWAETLQQRGCCWRQSRCAPKPAQVVFRSGAVAPT